MPIVVRAAHRIHHHHRVVEHLVEWAHWLHIAHDALFHGARAAGIH